MPTFTESDVEEATLAWLESLGYATLYGPDIAAGAPQAERTDPQYRDVVLERRLRQALTALNPDLPYEALEDAYRKITRLDAPSLMERNRSLHRLLVNGVPVEYRRRDGSIAGARARVLSFDHPESNDWLAVNQFTVAEGHSHSPAGRGHLREWPPARGYRAENPTDENATIWTRVPAAADLPGPDPRPLRCQRPLGGLRWGAGSPRCLGRRQGVVQALAHHHQARRTPPALLAEPRWCCRASSTSAASWTLLRYFIVFEDSAANGGGALVKKVAGYHQFHAVNAAVEETLRASRGGDGISDQRGRYEAGRRPGGGPGDRRVGVVWHTQGSGKSLTMAFYAGRVCLHPEMANPTIVGDHRPQPPRRSALWGLQPLPRPAPPGSGAGGRSG